MATHVHAFVQPITQPLDELHTHFSQVAAAHRDANSRLRAHADELLTSDTNEIFQGDGAAAFSGLVNYFIDTSEKHAQTFQDAALSVKTCHTSVMDATHTASSAGLHGPLVHKVLTRVTHDDVIQQGGDSIWAVVNDMVRTLEDMQNTAGSFFGDLFTGHFGDAWGDVTHEVDDAKRLVSDVTSLLQDIGHVLGQWASTICSAVGTCLRFIGTAAWNVIDFIGGFSSIVHDVQTLFDGKASAWDKVLAAGDLILNAGSDILMLTGIGEMIRGGELLFKGGLEGLQFLFKRFGKKGAQEIMVNLFKGDGTKILEKVTNLEGEQAFKALDPELKQVVKQTQKITNDQVKKLADLTKQAMERGSEPLGKWDAYSQGGPKLQKYLERITRSPMAKNWRSAYGYAVEEMSWDEMQKQGLDRTFDLGYNQPAPDELQWLNPTTGRSARPDLRMNLEDNKWNILDWTSEGYSDKMGGKILKYTSNEVDYLIEFLYKSAPTP